MKNKQTLSLGGVAIPITMAFLVMITILAVGLAESMRLERPVASSYLEKARANQMAAMAAEEVTAKLRYHTSAANRYWVSRPGELGLGNPLALSSLVPLHSGLPGTPPSPDPVFQAVTLNVRMVRPPYDHLITNREEANGAPAPMQIAWIYLRKDGTLETEPVLDLTNDDRAFVGRYAYWTDDESSKVNLNLAWGRSPVNTNPIGSPTKVDLTALPGMPDPATRYLRADAVRSFITPALDYAPLNRGFFNTPEDARQVSAAGVLDALVANKFETTHYNHDPDTTFFNEQRIVLTTSPSAAGWTFKGGVWVGKNGQSGKNGRPYYIRVLTDAAENAGSDPGLDANLSDAKVFDLLEMLTGAGQQGYLTRTDWPFASGASFQAKYGSAGRLTQIAFNIIDYVRARESVQNQVEPLRGRYLPGVSFIRGTLFFDDANCFISVTRTICVTELALYYDPVPGKSRVKVEIYLPREYGVDQVDLRDIWLWTTWGAETKILDTECSKPSFPGPSYLLRAGEYVVVSRAIPNNMIQNPATQVRVALSLAQSSRRVDLVPFLGTTRVSLPVNLPGAPEANICSIEVNDPRVNKHKDAWKTRLTGNSLGRRNDGTAGGKPIYTVGTSPASFSPVQDTDSAGNISDSSLYMPPPKGRSFARADGSTDDNTRGRLLSAGELGYIHTGVEAATGAGVPWRTLRLQPGSGSATVVPDWALIDLFTPPMTVEPNAHSVLAPHGNSVGGRVNINSKAAPFDLERILPLAAVLTNVQYETGNPALLPPGDIADADIPGTKTAVQLARNIYHALEGGAARLASNGRQYGHQGLYDSPGEIVEVKGIADGGERGEELVRNISNLITARGNVFTVYSIGQSLKQTANGRIVVTAESRSQTMVERCADSATGQLRVTPVYSREISR